MSGLPKIIDVPHHQYNTAFGDSEDKILLQPFNCISQIATKDTWRQLGKAFNYWLNVPEDKLKVIEESYQKFYYADLLFDDIRDNSASRGGKPSANAVDTMPCTLNALIYAHHLAAAAVSCLNHPQAPVLYLEQVDNTCSARWMEQYWSDTATCPTEYEYYDMIGKKTYGLITTQIKFMQLFSSNQDKFTKLSVIFGLYFHVVEDYLRFSFEEETEGEIYCEDVTLTGFTLPIIHAIKSGTYESEIVCGYKMKTPNPVQSMEHKIETVSILSYLNQMSNIQFIDNFKEQILKPYKYVNSLPKRYYLRTIIKLFNNTIKTPADKFSVILKIFYYIGYASFMLDDIQDMSILRKGIPCAYLVYGLTTTINAIIYTSSMALRHVLELNHPQAISEFFEPLLDSIRGQGMELYWRDNFVCPNEDEYVRMVTRKTGGAFGLVFNLMKLFSTTNLDLKKLPALMSLYFQVHDDYQNLSNQEYYDAKGFCEDLTEGKFGFPIIHAVHTHPKEDILRRRTYDVEVKKYCLSLLEKCGSFEYAKKKLKDFQKNMLEELQKFTDNQLLGEFIAKKFYITLEDINEND